MSWIGGSGKYKNGWKSWRGGGKFLSILFFFPSYFLYCSETQENSIHPWSVFFCYISLNPNIPCVLLSFFLCQVSVAEWFDNKVRLTQIYKGYIYICMFSLMFLLQFGAKPSKSLGMKGCILLLFRPFDVFFLNKNCSLFLENHSLCNNSLMLWLILNFVPILEKIFVL